MRINRHGASHVHIEGRISERVAILEWIERAKALECIECFCDEEDGDTISLLINATAGCVTKKDIIEAFKVSKIRRSTSHAPQL